MLKIVTVIGARPQLIKAAAISREIEKSYREQIEEVIIHTGQHYDYQMSSVFFEELNIPKEKYNLGVGSGSHAFQTAQIMLKLEPILLEEKPTFLLVYGDTNSTLAAALCAAKLFIPIVHVEAGVRSYNKDYPEEVNRILTDHLSAFLFTPTKAGFAALLAEGLRPNNELKKDYNSPGIYLCGDIMYDNTLYFNEKVDKNSILKKYEIENSFVLLTIHRASNVDDSVILMAILNAVVLLAEEFEIDFVFTVHPRTMNVIRDFGIEFSEKFLNHPHIKLIPPVSFLEMIALESSAELIITDSGGVQKEAYFLKKPCLILLNETPWVELVESNNSILVGNDQKKIKEGFRNLFHKKNLNFEPMYGNGHAANYIVETLVNHYKNV
jgi:UDP-GlcNAc3NAcA epimerase